MTDIKVRIDHNALNDDFLNHLNIQDNKRIIFSGPFGTGKSTFLREIFDNTVHNYVSLTLNPINYSISSNQDVFEMIKYDILIELINKHGNELDLTREDFSLFFLGQMFVHEKIKNPKTINSVLLLSETLNKPVSGLINLLKSTIADFKAFRSKLETDEGELIWEYLKQTKKGLGSYKEMDAISTLISELIERLRSKKGADDKEVPTILIIDDLDRLDPEHIFRLFNIFSAHYDLSDRNKFGFDKVIFVCDVENIRRIFNHRYGTDVDFNGYIDKFYSRNVFHFDNRKLIQSIIEKVINKIPYQNNNLTKNFLLHQRTNFYYAFESIISGLIAGKQMNLRMLNQYNAFKIPDYPFSIGRLIGLNARSYGLIVMVHYLKDFYPSLEILEQKLFHLSELFKEGMQSNTNYYSSSKHLLSHSDKEIISLCLPFLLPTKEGLDQDYIHQLNSGEAENKSRDFTYFLEDQQSLIHFRYDRSSYGDYIYYPVVLNVTEKNSEVEIPINVFQVLYTAFMSCKQKQIIA